MTFALIVGRRARSRSGRGKRWRATQHRSAAAFASAAFGVAGVAHAAPLDPTSFASLGTLNVTSGSITINTDTLGITGAATFNGGTVSQGGINPDIAVFTF